MAKSNTKTVLITQSNYIPWKGYFDAINMADEFIILDEVQYTRRDWRNRNRIVTNNGLKWLSISVSAKGNYLESINKIHTVDQNWRKSHWSLLKENYRKAPHFDDMAPLLEHEYFGNTETNLSRINEGFIQLIVDFLGINTKITRCEDYGVVGGKNERLIDLCEKANATRYLSGPAAKNYLDENLFRDSGLSVAWMDYSGYPCYPQLHGNFDHQVSILDLLFNMGPDSKQYMKSFG